MVLKHAFVLLWLPIHDIIEGGQESGMAILDFTSDVEDTIDIVSSVSTADGELIAE